MLKNLINGSIHEKIGWVLLARRKGKRMEIKWALFICCIFSSLKGAQENLLQTNIPVTKRFPLAGLSFFFVCSILEKEEEIALRFLKKHFIEQASLARQPQSVAQAVVLEEYTAPHICVPEQPTEHPVLKKERKSSPFKKMKKSCQVRVCEECGDAIGIRGWANHSARHVASNLHQVSDKHVTREQLQEGRQILNQRVKRKDLVDEATALLPRKCKKTLTDDAHPS